MSDTPPEHRTIFAMGGGGFSMEPDNLALDRYILALTGKERPKVCFLPTASGDSEEYIERFHASLETLGTEHSHLSLTRYNQRDPDGHLLDQDVIYVGGGNSFQMLLVWRAHGIDKTLRQAWEKGIILCGVSAGSLCWFSGSITDSWGHPLQVLNDGLGFLPESHCPHYDGEEQRRPLYQQLIAEGFPAGYAIDEDAHTVSQVWVYGGPGEDRFFSNFGSDADWLPTTGNILVTNAGPPRTRVGPRTIHRMTSAGLDLSRSRTRRRRRSYSIWSSEKATKSGGECVELSGCPVCIRNDSARPAYREPFCAGCAAAFSMFRAPSRMFQTPRFPS